MADPKRNRTIGVLTKVDLVDREKDVLKWLRNSQVALTHGYVALKNRSQEDLWNNVMVKEGLAE